MVLESGRSSHQGSKHSPQKHSLQTNWVKSRFLIFSYSLFYQSQHNIEVELENVNSKQKNNTVLEKAKSKICLPSKGTYKVTPKSCQKFKDPFYIYNTDKSTKLIMVPIEFLAKGMIQLDDTVMKGKLNLTEVKVNINLEEKLENNTIVPYKKMVLNIKQKDNAFSFYTKPNTNLLITAAIPEGDALKEGYKNLLFLPKEKVIAITQNCIEDASELTFHMKSGLILEGKVTPQMDNVVVSAINKNSGELIASTSTDAKGAYKIGPLNNENNYEIKAVKDGYKIVSDPKNSYNFNAEKLSFLRVKIVDTANKPLSSVFLSLSSADRGFRINNNSNQEGYFDFVELYSGDYYIKPMFKEYKFEPAQKLVKILGGQHYEEVFVAHRIAFSIYGKSK